jgi:uncharacterized protein (DUF1778 family)
MYTADIMWEMPRETKARENKSEVVLFRVTPKEKKKLDRAAALHERTLADYTRRAMVKKAEEDLKATRANPDASEEEDG